MDLALLSLLPPGKKKKKKGGKASAAVAEAERVASADTGASERASEAAANGTGLAAHSRVCDVHFLNALILQLSPGGARQAWCCLGRLTA